MRARSEARRSDSAVESSGCGGVLLETDIFDRCITEDGDRANHVADLVATFAAFDPDLEIAVGEPLHHFGDAAQRSAQRFHQHQAAGNGEQGADHHGNERQLGGTLAVFLTDLLGLGDKILESCHAARQGFAGGGTRLFPVGGDGEELGGVLLDRFQARLKRRRELAHGRVSGEFGNFCAGGLQPGDDVEDDLARVLRLRGAQPLDVELHGVDQAKRFGAAVEKRAQAGNLALDIGETAGCIAGLAGDLRFHFGLEFLHAGDGVAHRLRLFRNVLIALDGGGKSTDRVVDRLQLLDAVRGEEGLNLLERLVQYAEIHVGCADRAVVRAGFLDGIAKLTNLFGDRLVGIGFQHHALGEFFLAFELLADIGNLIRDPRRHGAHVVDAVVERCSIFVAPLLDLPEHVSLGAHLRREADDDGDTFVVAVGNQQILEDIDAALLLVDRRLQGGKRRIVGLAVEFLENRLEIFEITDVLDRRTRHGHMTVQHAGRVITRKADPGDQKHQRYDKKKDLGDDPAALKKTIDKGHFSPTANQMRLSRQRHSRNGNGTIPASCGNECDLQSSNSVEQRLIRDPYISFWFYPKEYRPGGNRAGDA